MSAQLLADVVTAIREMVGDTGINREQTIRTETPDGKMDGTNNIFTLQFYPIEAATFKLYKNGALLVGGGTDYTLTAGTGTVVMTVAPAYSDRLVSSYQFKWFEDTRYHEFIWHAGQRVGVTATTTGNPSDRAAAMVLALDDGLMDAVRLFSACEYCLRRATEAAHKVASSGGGQTVSPQSITSQFEKLGKGFCDRAVAARDEFFEGKGRREKPASGISKFDPILRYQPRR